MRIWFLMLTDLNVSFLGWLYFHKKDYNLPFEAGQNEYKSYALQ